MKCSFNPQLYWPTGADSSREVVKLSLSSAPVVLDAGFLAERAEIESK